jgi:branched-chain amino acid transport system substrate-binding protein
MPASGYFQAQNQQLAQGAQIAADEINAKGGIGGSVKIKLVAKKLAADADPRTVMSSLRASSTKVVVLPCDVDSTASLAKAGSSLGLLMLLPCDPNPKLGTAYPMLWPVGMPGNEQVAQLVAFAGRNNTPTAYIVTAKGPAYLSELVKYYRAAAKSLKIKIVGESVVPLTGANTAALARQLKRTHAIAVFTPIFSPFLQPIVAGLRAHGFYLPVYASDGMDADLRLVRYGKALEGLLIGSFGFPGPAAKQFLKDYKQAYRKAVEGSFPSLGFETIKVLETASLKARSSDPVAINKAFEKGFSVPVLALEPIVYPGNGVHQPVTSAGIARIIRSQHVALVSSDPHGSVPVPAP